MDFRVTDLLRIPFLKDAEVRAGKNGIRRVLNRYYELHTHSPEKEYLLTSQENDILIFADDLSFWTEEQLERSVLNAVRCEAGCLVMFSAVSGYQLPESCIAASEAASIPLIVVTSRRLPAGILSREIMLTLLQFNRDNDYLKEVFLYSVEEKELSSSDLQVIRQCSDYDFSAVHQAVCITPERVSDQQEKKALKSSEIRIIRETALQWLSEHQGQAVQGIRNQSFLFFLPQGIGSKGVESSVASLIKELEQVVNGVNFLAGIGSSQESPEQWKKSMREARQVVRAMRIFEWKGIRTVWDAQPAVLLLDIRDQGKLIQLRDPLISPLYAFSSKDSTDRELVHTLEMYFFYGKNASLTAEKMYLHRNTLTLRLKKIEKLCGFDLSDPVVCRRLEFAIYVEKCLFLGQFEK